MGSWLSRFVFDPIKAAVSRAQTSANPIAQQVGAAAEAAISQVQTDTSINALSHNSAVGVKNTVVGDLETGIKGVVDSFVYALVATGMSSVPGGSIVAPVLAQDTVQAANVGLDFAEQHLLTYISALIGFHRQNINAAAQPAPAPVAVPVEQAA